MKYLALVLLLAACATQNIPAGSPSFQQGYKDGNSSGHAACGNVVYHQYKKNVQQYASNSDYKIGWDDGFQMAKGSYVLSGCP